MTTNMYRALTLILTMITGFLFWLCAHILHEGFWLYAYQIPPLGEWLVPIILLISALPMAWIILSKLAPRLSSDTSITASGINRLILCLVMLGIFVLGLIL